MAKQFKEQKEGFCEFTGYQVLSQSARMIRDCWIDDKDPDRKWLVIRQIGFDEDGASGVITKLLRLEPEEVRLLLITANSVPL